MARTGVATRVEEQSSDRPRSWLRRQIDQVNTLVVAVLLALCVRAFVIEPFRIPSGSMLPTLLVGDHLFVNKFVYGIKIPFTDVRLPSLRKPERGDVIVFTVARDGQAIIPADQRPELPQEEFVKRVVALPGDTVEVELGVLRVNGKPVEVRDTGDTYQGEFGRKLKVRLERSGRKEYRLLDDPGLVGLQQQRFTVLGGRYFAMGDNRDHSNDSRAWGTVAMADIKGPAFILYWSWNNPYSWAAMANPLTWWKLLIGETRWHRIGDRVR